MWFWWYLLVCDSLIPIVMIIFGRWMWKHCPKRINSIIGYRTRRSMKNDDTWKFAHEYAGKLWWKIGWIILAPTILVHIPFRNADGSSISTISIIVIVIQLIILIGSIIPTEKALKNKFEKE